MSYSRRQLYALGEPLGDSVTTKKVGGGRIYGGGGGGGGSAPAAGPTQSTSYSTNLPEYAQPYVENMLNSAQAQIYNPDMTTFRPYVPYSNNPQDYIAEASPLQKQAYTSAANMQSSPGMPIYEGLSGLAGASYASQATNPGATAAYMSPYMQNVVDVQKAQATRDAQKGLVAQNMAAARQGTYGGARNALMQSEADRNLQTQLGQIQATGQQNAFQNAQQAQQFGANLGLQGYNQAANIAGQQLNQQQGIANLQNTYGAQQQAQQQQAINQAIQNYSTAQQYPFMQLGIMNSMLRGLPMQSTTTASYQAQPSTAMQAAGLLGAAGNLYGGKGAREGGIIGMKEGGSVPGYRYGTIINEPQLESMTNRMDDKQLNQVKGLPGVTPDERNTFDSALINNQYVRSNPEAAQMMAQAAPPQQAPAPTDRMSGIAQGGGDMFNTMGSRMAGGGIIAFAGEGPSAVDEAIAKAERDAATQDAEAKAKAKSAPAVVAQKAINKDAVKDDSRMGFLKEYQAMMKSQGVNPEAVGEKGKAYQAALEAQQAGVGGKEDQMERMARAKAFLSLTQPTGGKNALGQIGSAFGEYLGEKAGNIKAIEELKMGNAKAQAEMEAGNRARAAGDIEAANKHYDKAAEIKKDLQVANIHAAAAGASQRSEEAQIKRLQDEYKAKTGQDLSYADAMRMRTDLKSTASESIEGQNRRAAQTALQEWKKSVMYTEEWMKMTPEQKTAAENAEYQKILGRFGATANAPAAGAPAPQAGSPVTVSNKAEYDKLKPGQTYFDPNGQLRVKG
jgi:hypothetical protein